MRPRPRSTASVATTAAARTVAGVPDPRVYDLLAALGALAFAAVAIGIVAGPHRVGDYMTETDFYGAYAQGARLVQHGRLDPSRYGVIGPGYEVALALAGSIVLNLFLAAELLSVASAITVLVVWHALLRRRAGAAVACVAVLVLATNGTFLRHAYSVTTDTFAIALEALALLALLGGRRPAPGAAMPRMSRATVPDVSATGAPGPDARRMAMAGLVAACAFLTRYNAVVLLPAGAITILAGGCGAARRARAAIAFAAGFIAPVLAWILYSRAHGGSFALQLHHNIAYEVYAHARGIPWDDYQRKLQPLFHNLWDVLARDPGAVAARVAFNFVDHPRLDALRLLTWPVALATLWGLVRFARESAWRPLWPVALTGGLLFLSLVPVFYGERYSLALLPMYATFAGVGLAPGVLAARFGTRRIALEPWLAGLALLVAGSASAAVQRNVMNQLPTEVLAAADTLRSLARPGDRVIARKGHIAFHAGVEPVPFPFADSLAALAGYAAANRARWIWFSWPEAETRPALAFLLDTAAVVPGLVPRAVTHPHPGVLYEVVAGFGQRPAWMANDTLVSYRHRRAALFLDGNNPRRLYNCAVSARALGRLDESEHWLERLMQITPDDVPALMLQGEVLLQQNRPERAEPVFDRLITLDPGNPLGAVGRGWSLLLQNRLAEAAAAWRPAIDTTRDRRTLQQMAALFARLGDREAAARANARLIAGGSR